MDELGLVDAYRVLHPKKTAFTYESKSLKLKSRIDVFLITQTLKSNIRTAEIRSSTFMELIKMEFRSETISYSKAKRKEFKNRETCLQGKLNALDNEICRGNNHFNRQLLDEYESIKIELKDIYEKKRQRSHVPFKSMLD